MECGMRCGRLWRLIWVRQWVLEEVGSCFGRLQVGLLGGRFFKAVVARVAMYDLHFISSRVGQVATPPMKPPFLLHINSCSLVSYSISATGGLIPWMPAMSNDTYTSRFPLTNSMCHRLGLHDLWPWWTHVLLEQTSVTCNKAETRSKKVNSFRPLITYALSLRAKIKMMKVVSCMHNLSAVHQLKVAFWWWYHPLRFCQILDYLGRCGFEYDQS